MDRGWWGVLVTEMLWFLPMDGDNNSLSNVLHISLVFIEYKFSFEWVFNEYRLVFLGLQKLNFLNKVKSLSNNTSDFACMFLWFYYNFDKNFVAFEKKHSIFIILLEINKIMNFIGWTKVLTFGCQKSIFWPMKG